MEQEGKSPLLELKVIGGIIRSGVADHFHSANSLATQPIVIIPGGTSYRNWNIISLPLITTAILTLDTFHAGDATPSTTLFLLSPTLRRDVVDPQLQDLKNRRLHKYADIGMRAVNGTEAHLSEAEET